MGKRESKFNKKVVVAAKAPVVESEVNVDDIGGMYDKVIAGQGENHIADDTSGFDIRSSKELDDRLRNQTDLVLNPEKEPTRVLASKAVEGMEHLGTYTQHTEKSASDFEREFNAGLREHLDKVSAAGDDNLPGGEDVDMDEFGKMALKDAGVEGHEIPGDSEFPDAEAKEGKHDEAKENKDPSDLADEVKETGDMAKDVADKVSESANMIADLVGEIQEAVEDISNASVEDNLDMAADVAAGNDPTADAGEEPKPEAPAEEKLPEVEEKPAPAPKPDKRFPTGASKKVEATEFPIHWATGEFGTVGFAISVGDEYILKANAEEKGIDWNAVTTDKLVEDANKLERRAMDYLRKRFGRANDEGHSDDELIGTIDIRDEAAANDVREVLDRGERLTESVGLNLPIDFYNGLNYPEIYSVEIDLFAPHWPGENDGIEAEGKKVEAGKISDEAITRIAKKTGWSEAEGFVRKIAGLVESGKSFEEIHDMREIREKIYWNADDFRRESDWKEYYNALRYLVRELKKKAGAEKKDAQKVQAKTNEGVILFADGARGIYIPQYFAQSIKKEMVRGVSDEDWQILEAGPDHDLYWETWDTVERNAEVTLDGHKYTLTYGEGGGDLFLICPELMSDEEKENFGIEAEEPIEVEGKKRVVAKKGWPNVVSAKELDEGTGFFGSRGLVDELKEKMKKGDTVVNFAYTDYGGDFMDRVAIQYFQEEHPDSIVFENTRFFGKNAFIFGDVAKEFVEATKSYLLGFESMEEFYSEKQSEAEDASFQSFIDDISEDKYKFVYGKEEALKQIREEFSGYWGINSDGQADYSEDKMIDFLIDAGQLVEKSDDDGDDEGPKMPPEPTPTGPSKDTDLQTNLFDLKPQAVKAIQAYVRMHRRIDEADFAKVCAGLGVKVEAGLKVIAAKVEAAPRMGDSGRHEAVEFDALQKEVEKMKTDDPEYDKKKKRLDELKKKFGASAKAEGMKVVAAEVEHFTGDDMVDGYLTAAIWAESARGEYEGNDPDGDASFMDEGFSLADFDEKAVAKAKADVAEFRKMPGLAQLLEEAGLDDEQAGINLWLSSRGHGAGFGDTGTEADDKIDDFVQKNFRENENIDMWADADRVIHFDGADPISAKVEGGAKRPFESTASAEVLWSNGDRKITRVSDKEVDLEFGLHSDRALRHDDGSIVYDRPEDVPADMKEAVKKIFNKKSTAGLFDSKQVKWDIYRGDKKLRSMYFPPEWDHDKVFDALVEKYGHYGPDIRIKKSKDQTAKTDAAKDPDMARYTYQDDSGDEVAIDLPRYDWSDEGSVDKFVEAVKQAGLLPSGREVITHDISEKGEPDLYDNEESMTEFFRKQAAAGAYADKIELIFNQPRPGNIVAWDYTQKQPVIMSLTPYDSDLPLLSVESSKSDRFPTKAERAPENADKTGTVTAAKKATPERLAEAAKYGKEAFEAGIKSAPHYDPRMMEMIRRGNPNVVESDTIDILDAWNKAWHAANAAAPVDAPAETPRKSNHMEVANTILRQLGGNKFLAMTGAKNLIGTDEGMGGLVFSLPGRMAKNGINVVRIILNAMDTYDVKFEKLGRAPKFERTTVSEIEGVYEDMLRDVFTKETGLQTSLGTMTGKKVEARTEDEIRKDIRELRRRMFDDGANEEEIKKQLDDKKNELNALLGGRILEDSFVPVFQDNSGYLPKSEKNIRVGFNYKNEKSDKIGYYEITEYSLKRGSDGRWHGHYESGSMAELKAIWTKKAKEVFDQFVAEENAKVEKHLNPTAGIEDPETNTQPSQSGVAVGGSDPKEIGGKCEVQESSDAIATEKHEAQLDAIVAVKEMTLEEFEEAGLDAWRTTQADWVRMMKGQRERIGQPATDRDIVEFKNFHREDMENAIQRGWLDKASADLEYPGLYEEAMAKKSARESDASQKVVKLGLGGMRNWIALLVKNDKSVSIHSMSGPKAKEIYQSHLDAVNKQAIDTAISNGLKVVAQSEAGRWPNKGGSERKRPFPAQQNP